ncbi:hypothetical protein FD755_025229 [Muntiacus reevesi]|uniref:SH2 domain-containing protein n=1 Tax=Muntiacus reevesi TaxID=9886 RepID=A0A5N3UPF7_MUNRE|nr:hypothetical protein FD755_025229 [Muntiacus reevesi]
MAKWLNKYPPQRPRHDYGEQRRQGEWPSQPPQAMPQIPAAAFASCGTAATSCFSTSSGSLPNDSGSTSDLICTYRAQKERVFEDPYNRPGSSLRKLQAMCRLDYCSGEPGGSQRAFSALSASGTAGCCCASSGADATASSSPSSGSPHLYCSSRERRPAIPAEVTITDDYSDPFDAKNDLKSKAGKGESTGYTEPYEQESVRSKHKGIQLYDTPYEPEGQSVDSDSESMVSPRLRESKLPQDDDRPADEYDQPGYERWQSSPSPSRDWQRQLRALRGGFKPIKHGGPEFCGILGERVDPAVPLKKQIWYHGAISRGDTENLLRLCKECSYLVRNSQTSRHDYSLSLKSNQGFMHMKLAKTKEKYVLDQNNPPFDTVPEVIHYYTTRKLPIKGAEHLSLYPMAVRTL